MTKPPAWRVVLLIAGGVVLVCITVFAVMLWPVYYCMRYPTPEPDAPPVIWSDYEGVAMTTDGGRTIRRWWLPGQDGGARSPWPIVAFSDTSIVYWAENDRAICIMEHGRAARWISMEKHVKPGTKVEAVAYRPGIVLLTLSKKPAPSYVVSIDTGTGRIEVVPDIGEAQSLPGTHSVVVRRSNGRVQSYPDGPGRQFGRDTQLGDRFTYDTAAQRAAAIRDGWLVIYQQDGKLTQVEPRCGSVMGVWAQPHRRHFAVISHGAFSKVDILAYGYDGTSNGCYATVYVPVNSVLIAPSKQVLELLSSLPSEVFGGGWK